MIRERSAGGVVVRRFRGRPFFAAIATRDGSRLGLPKGHVADGEAPLETARREIHEETGLVAEPIGELGRIEYWYVREGERVRKTVDFFLFRYRSGRLADHDQEVDWAEWVPLEAAERRLSYRGERSIAAAALSRLADSR